MLSVWAINCIRLRDHPREWFPTYPHPTNTVQSFWGPLCHGKHRGAPCKMFMGEPMPPATPLADLTRLFQTLVKHLMPPATPMADLTHPLQNLVKDLMSANHTDGRPRTYVPHFGQTPHAANHTDGRPHTSIPIFCQTSHPPSHTNGKPRTSVTSSLRRIGFILQKILPAGEPKCGRP